MHSRTRRPSKPIKPRLRQLLPRLERMYGKRHWERRGSGLDHLIGAMLSQNTNMVNARSGYRQLRRAFPTWAQVLAAPVDQVQRHIAVCGLARMRARRLQQLLARVKEDFGKLSLNALAAKDPRDAYDYLLTFHGIGPKTAAFTLLFGFNQPVLPIDNGILRVLHRLRLVRPKARDKEAEEVLSPAIPRGRHYALHVLLFQHAKERCRPKNPKCDECALLSMCPFGQRRLRHHPPPEVIPPARRRAVPLSRFISAGVAKRGESNDSAE